ncbi:hypothetical protein, partial [Staphylococcus aureus]|uniref:hypothetical protein n=1 Tax=Staphylococcus aureus TaxID=1280 RepID=UPI0038B3535D
MFCEPPQAATIGMIKDNADSFVEHFQQKPQPTEREDQSESLSDLPNCPPQAETTDVLNNNEVCLDEELEQKPQSG